MLMEYRKKKKQEWVNWFFKIHLNDYKVNEYYVYTKKLNLELMSRFKKNKSLKRLERYFLFRNIIQSLLIKGKYLHFKNKILKYFLLNYKNLVSLTSDNALSGKYLLVNLFNVLDKVEFFFKHSYHRVDKKVRKFSRGKSGKYTLKFNYVPPFKRFKHKLKVLKTELKLAKGISFIKRLDYFLKLSKTNFSETYLYKSKIFAYNRVYRDHYFTTLTNAT